MNESVCNSKQKWNHDEYWCECKESDDSSSCNDGCMWNPVECNKACKIEEYVDIENCLCK